MRSFKASPGIYLVLGWPFVGMLAFVLCRDLIGRGGPDDWKLTAVMISVIASGIFWLSSFRLDVSSDSIAYTTLFHRRSMLRRADIVFAGFVFEDSFQPSGDFVLRDRLGGELRIHAKLFSREAVRELIALSSPIESGREATPGGPRRFPDQINQP